MSRYSPEQLRTAYTMAHAIPNSDDRIDCDGRRIRWSDYGDRSRPYGWEVDHWPIPQCDGGSDAPWNLRARHCTGNAMAGGYLGAHRRDEPEAPRNALHDLLNSLPAPPGNAMLELARLYSDSPVANALAGLPRLPRR
jgi:hypothetical protein